MSLLPNRRRAATGRGARARPVAFLARAVMVEAFIGLAAIGTAWAGAAYLQQNHRARALNEAADDVSRMSRAYAAGAARTLDALDTSLLLSRAAFVAGQERFDVAKWAQDVGRSARFSFNQISAIGADGRVLSSSVPGKRGLDLSWRDWFKAQAASRSDTLYVGNPGVGALTGKPALQLSRGLRGKDGALQAVFVASLDPLMLSKPFGYASTGPGDFLLVGMDGPVKSRLPFRPGKGWGDMRGSPLLSAAASSPTGHVRLVGDDGREKLYGFCRLEGYPILAAYGLDEREVLAPYERMRTFYDEVAIGFTLLVAATFAAMVRHKAGLAAYRRALQLTMESMDQGIVMVDGDGRVSVFNSRAAELLGVPAEAGSMVAALEAVGTPTMPPHDLKRGGIVLEVRTSVTGDGGIVRTFSDVTERRASEARIRHVAHHDQLTGIANRALFGERLADEIAAAGEAAGPAVVVCGLDRFKQVNDMRGHEAGDEILRSAAARLRDACGEAILVARTGGDEFAIMVPALASPAAVAARAVDALALPFTIDGVSFVVGASAGGAAYPADGATAGELVRHADTAMQRAKASGGGTFLLYRPEMEARLNRRRTMERDLRDAVASGKLHLAYQPICDARHAGVVGFEALVRWNHPELGNVPPSDFIPVAEESGLIVQLGAWVLEHACREAASWPGSARIAVNMSPPQLLQPDLAERVDAILARTGLSPRRLDLEVTESIAIMDPEAVSATLGALRERGIGISLDDFGTGHSSLGYISRFRFDKVKIDRSFVQDMAADGQSLALVRAVMALGRSLGLDIVAEGVETSDQLKILRTLRCGFVQGYLLGRPMSPDDARRLLDAGHPPPAPMERPENMLPSPLAWA